MLAVRKYHSIAICMIIIAVFTWHCAFPSMLRNYGMLIAEDQLKKKFPDVKLPVQK